MSNLTYFRTLITFSSHVRTMNRAVLGAGRGLTVTLEIRHSVIPGGFVRACARREHPPSSASHFPATIISGCHDRPARAFLLRIPSSFNSPTRRTSWMSPRPLVFVVLAFPRAHASLYAGSDLSYSLFRPSMQVSSFTASSANQTITRIYSLVFLYQWPAFFLRPRGKRTSESSLVNFGPQFRTFRLPRNPRSS